jgi:hypothetical protein
MTCRSRRTIRIAILMIALAAGLMFPSAPWILAQESALKDAVSVSPTWRYAVRWYSGEWTVVDEASDGKTDRLALQDTLGNTVSFSGSGQFYGDAATCLDDMVKQVLASPGAANPETVEGDIGMLYDLHEPEHAYTLMQVQLPVDGVLRDHAVYLECQTLVPGEPVFRRYYSGPVEVFDQWYDDIVETLEGVFLPASAWLPIPDAEQQIWMGFAPLSGEWRTNASLLADEQGNPLLLIGLPDAAGDIRVVTIENVSDGPVTIKPEDFVLTVSSMAEEGTGPSQAPYSVTWNDDVNANADGSRELQPGEIATAQVAIAAIDESTITCDDSLLIVFEYRQPESDLVLPLASNPVTTCVQTESFEGGVPAAAGRPKLRLSR